MNLELELVVEGLRFPEGPVALADGSVVLTEIVGRRLTRIAPDGSKSGLAEGLPGPNGLAVGPDGAFYVTDNGGSFSYVERQGLIIPGPTPPEHVGGAILRVDPSNGAVTTLYEACDGRRLVGPNDLVFDAHGGFWFTDHGASTPDGRRYGALYYAKADGSAISRQRSGLISPNGVGLSPAGDVVYVADTHLGRLWAFDVEAPGRLAPLQPLSGPGRVIANLPGYQLLDSLAVEAGGRICVATIINGGVTVFDPDGTTEHVPVPDPLVTNICFGGPDMRTAWITASGTGRLYRCTWPRPGLRLAHNT